MKKCFIVLYIDHLGVGKEKRVKAASFKDAAGKVASGPWQGAAPSSPAKERKALSRPRYSGYGNRVLRVYTCSKKHSRKIS